ncbi:MAG: cupin domain-containing protein [Verrucomicrobia bacterium]|nr:cupin domain-containing protein [Verrucomicrobiota bacterium]
MAAMSVGKRIESFRKKKELTIENLAEKSGVKLQIIQAIENEEVVPSIGTMIKLARALGLRLGSFMDDQFKEDPLIVRKADRAERLQKSASSSDGYEYYSLGEGKPDRHTEPFYVVIDSKENHTSSHEGEEFIYVVSGQLELTCGKTVEILNPGDTAYYDSLVPHSLRSAGTAPAEIVAVVMTPF